MFAATVIFACVAAECFNLYWLHVLNGHSFSNQVVLMLGLGMALTVLCTTVTNFLRAEQRALLTPGGMIFPLGNITHLRGRRWRTWTELHSSTLASEEPASLVLRFKDGCQVTFSFATMSKQEVERLLVTVETWAPNKRIGQFEDYRNSLADSLLDSGAKSYTALWNDELARRFKLCTFVPLAPGTSLQEGRYRIVSHMAFGGFAAVYNALDARGHAVAIKELSLETLRSEEARKQVAVHIEREVAVLARLQHPQICKMLDSFVERGRNYIVLERIGGKNLRQWIAENGCFSEAQTVSAAGQMMEILTYLHGLSPPVVHRDFTPENLIWTDDSSLVLVDFNTASELVSGLTGTVVGKVCYMPPEQVRGKAQPASDYYAMGCTLSFMLTGVDPKPFTAINLDHSAAHASPQLTVLVFKLTQPNLIDRPATAAELLQLVQLVQARGPKTVTKHG